RAAVRGTVVRWKPRSANSEVAAASTRSLVAGAGTKQLLKTGVSRIQAAGGSNLTGERRPSATRCRGSCGPPAHRRRDLATLRRRPPGKPLAARGPHAWTRDRPRRRSHDRGLRLSQGTIPLATAVRSTRAPPPHPPPSAPPLPHTPHL